jgi:hypothetical protein
VRILALIAAIGSLTSSAATAQVPVDPVFQLQPGLSTSNFVSTPEEASTTGFILRFQTRFPMRRLWLQPVIGASFTPYGTTGFGVPNTDAPTIFAGNIFTVIDARRGSGWLTAEVPLVIAHAPGAATSGNVREYGRDVLLQPTVYVHIGRRLFGEFGAAWSRLDIIVLLEQSLTPNRHPDTDARDFFNPVSVIGASLTLGGPTPR